MSRLVSGAKFEQEISSLLELPRVELVQRWKALFRSDPPKGISTSLLLRAVAYQMQVKRFSGPRSALRATLKRTNGAAGSGASPRAGSINLKPGARLVREWNGATHVVDVVAGGFSWEGKMHRSLSAIAHEITGARWSGPRFFGLPRGESP